MELSHDGVKLPHMELLVTLQRFELRLFASIFGQTEKRMVIPVARAVSRSGDGYLHALVAMLVWVLEPAKAWLFLPLLAMSLAIERPLYWLLKNSLRRPRPQEAIPGFRSLITASDRFSFPSGHSAGAFLLSTTLFLVYGSVAIPMFVWAFGVALSRILLGVHFPADTLAGAFMGSVIAAGCAAALGVV